jgi:hypothetical protein
MPLGFSIYTITITEQSISQRRQQYGGIFPMRPYARLNEIAEATENLYFEERTYVHEDQPIHW